MREPIEYTSPEEVDEVMAELARLEREYEATAVPIVNAPMDRLIAAFSKGNFSVTAQEIFAPLTVEDELPF